MINATVYRSTGSWYDVKDATGQLWKARIKGVFKIEGLSSTNPIAVGDVVSLEIENEDTHIATIAGIKDRHNYISRQSPSHRRQHHIVASNLDQVLLVATIKDPRTSNGFMDRFLAAAEAYHVPAILLINKQDAWKEKDKAKFEEWAAIYSQIGYQIMAVSVQQGAGMNGLHALLKNKTTLVSGHSGVGKSSLLNALIPGFTLRTKEVSGWSGKGMHTTTFAEMFDLPDGGRIIDTPGIREFGIVDIEREELSHYFPEMRAVMQNCQFNNCLHVNEPGCAVKQAVSDGSIAPGRFASYLSILDTIKENEWE